jgi:hypothetical protein
VFLVVLELSLVLAAVSPLFNTSSVLDIINPVTLVLGSIGLCELAISISFIVNPLT